MTYGEHGSVTRASRGCPCDACRITWRQYHREYRAAKRKETKALADAQRQQAGLVTEMKAGTA